MKDCSAIFYYSESSGGRRRGNPGRTFIYKKTAGAGAIVDIGVYNMHNSLYAMGYPKPVRVSAITEDYISQQDPQFRGIMDVEEFGVAWVRFEDGGVMVFQNLLGDSSGFARSEFSVLGKEMGIALDGAVVYADAYTDDLKKLVKSEGLTAEPNPPEGMTTIRFSGFPEVEVWEAQMTAFREAVKSRRHPPRYRQRVCCSRT